MPIQSPETSQRRTAAARIASLLRSRIIDGTYVSGSMFPGRRALAGELSVACPTVDRAVKALVAEGLLRTEDRRGTFVSYQKDVPEDNPAQAGSRGEQTGANSPALLGIIASFRPSYVNRTDNLERWVSTILTTLDLSFRENGSSTILCNIDRGPEYPFVSLPEATEKLLSRKARAICVVDPFGLFSQTEIDGLIASGLPARQPTVYIGASEIHGPLPHLMWDSDYTGFQAVQHLIERGAREILFAAPFDQPWIAGRIASARQAVAYAGLPETALRVAECDHPIPPLALSPDEVSKNLDRFAASLVERGQVRGGIVAGNDFAAYAIMDAADKAGLIAGRDYLIAGIDNAPMSMALELTTLRPPIEELASEAALLLQRAVNNLPIRLQVRLRAQLLARASTLGAALAGARS